ncbi:hypothetical protein Nepgr_002084 [Nepenthes gracilis]|uniref:PPC domain-containing protein n=1 Tax=Nepenthes gracilis TaxID=150966 RepID=A0AAD3RY92_NEPGR|nr:hypothetical protein Nepgr_002084 [Nepenthes gracilis]
MKAKFLDEKDTTSNMFSKFHQKFQPPLQPDLQSHPHFHPTIESQASKEADSATPTATTTITGAPSAKKTKTANEDGATIEVARRPRGRPPGSKNKPKPPVIITREPEPIMSPYILEVAGGLDIVESLTRFTRRRNVGICVLSASGTVANVTLKQPSPTNLGGTVTFHGRFDILSLSATLLCGEGGFGFNGHGTGLFTISLAGPQGQIVGGKVVGSLVAAGTVFVIAASFNNPSFHRLPLIDTEEAHRSLSSGGGGRHDGQANGSPGVSGGNPGSGGGGGGHPMGAAETCGSLGGMFGCHLGSSDVLWAPTASRLPPPPF